MATQAETVSPGNLNPEGIHTRAKMVRPVSLMVVILGFY